MILTLNKITQKYRLSGGMTKANGYECNGDVYEFSNNEGKLFFKYSFNVWNNVCKYRIKLSDEIIELQKNYIKGGMIEEAKQLETDLPFEGDVYDFDFSLKNTGYGDQIKTIRKPRHIGAVT